MRSYFLKRKVTKDKGELKPLITKKSNKTTYKQFKVDPEIIGLRGITGTITFTAKNKTSGELNINGKKFTISYKIDSEDSKMKIILDKNEIEMINRRIAQQGQEPPQAHGAIRQTPITRLGEQTQDQAHLPQNEIDRPQTPERIQAEKDQAMLNQLNAMRDFCIDQEHGRTDSAIDQIFDFVYLSNS